MVIVCSGSFCLIGEVHCSRYSYIEVFLFCHASVVCWSHVCTLCGSECFVLYDLQFVCDVNRDVDVYGVSVLVYGSCMLEVSFP